MSGAPQTAVALDHVGVAARALAPLLAQYQRLGFDLSPLAQQSGRRTPEGQVELFGSGNRCAFFKHGYVELIGILDPALYPNAVDQFVARYHGLHIAAFAMADAEANLARLRAGGLAIPGVAYLERPVEAGGPTARFARLPFPDAPEGRVQLITHLTPELVWDPRWMHHANKVEALEALVLVAANPAETAARCQCAVACVQQSRRRPPMRRPLRRPWGWVRPSGRAAARTRSPAAPRPVRRCRPSLPPWPPLPTPTMMRSR